MYVELFTVLCLLFHLSLGWFWAELVRMLGRVFHVLLFQQGEEEGCRMPIRRRPLILYYDRSSHSHFHCHVCLKAGRGGRSATASIDRCVGR